MDFYEDLHPMIRHIPVQHPDGNCRCNGTALEFNAHLFSQHVEQYLPPTGPVLTKRGQIAKRQPPKPKAQPYTWWKAQCSFRSSNPKGTVAELQARLRGHEKDPISKDNLELLERAKKEFKIKRDEVTEIKWLHHMSAEEKMRTNPGRYLKEAFPAGDTGTGVLVIKGWHMSTIAPLAEDIGLECETVEAPMNRDHFMPIFGDIWVVVGRNNAIVAEKVRSVSREAQRIKKEIRHEEEEQRREEEAIEKKKQQDLKKALAKSKDWDVTGRWKINCPYIEKNWPRQPSDEEESSLHIYQERTAKGAQMFAKFNFGVTTGVFRFERQRDDTKAKIAKPDTHANKKKRKRYDSEDEDDHEDNSSEQDGTDGEYDEERERSPTPEAFYFGSITQPSAKHQTWNYRWRGEETGEGVIELYSDKRLFKMKFFGPKVEKLEGTFGGDMFEDCMFTGVKVGVGGEVDIDISEEWSERNEGAYESARVGRWH
jgi:hypothetical protein